MKLYILLISLSIFSLSPKVSGQNPNVLPHWAFGGFIRPEGKNPVIEPDVSTTFYCPMNGKSLKWEESDTFNPAAVVKDGKIYVLYRAEDNSATGIGSRTSRVGLAESSDGTTMNRRTEPVLYPDEDNKEYEWRGGCEDPRVAATEDGTFVMFYTGWNRNNGMGISSKPRLCVATSVDLQNWTKHGPAFARMLNGKYKDMESKSASIVTKVVDGKQVICKVNGKYLMYWGEKVVCMATSDNLIDWEMVENAQGTPLEVAKVRPGYFDSDLVECGPPAIWTKNGIVLLYNGKNRSDNNRDPRFNAGTYSAGQMLFDAGAPEKLITRLDVPFFRPMDEFEKSGQYKDGTVFIEGMAYYNNKWYLYYGCADSKVGVAIFDPMSEAEGDPVPDYPKGNGFGAYPFNGIGKKAVTIHSSSGEAASEETAFNLLYNHINTKAKWCDNKNEKPWVIFKLNDIYAIDKLVFRDVAPYEAGNGNVPEYWIYVSTTGPNDADFKEIVHKTNQGAVDIKEDVFLNPIHARYVKYVMTKGIRTDNGANENAIRIYGMDFYGTIIKKTDWGNLVSAGKTVLAYYDAAAYYEEPLHLLDGEPENPSNKWTFKKAGENDSLKYVVIDLEEEYDVEKFRIYDIHYLEPNIDSNIDDYTIYLSRETPDISLISNTEDKNICWTQVVNTNGRLGENIKTDAITPTKARYVKLEIPRSRVSGTTQLFQFEVYKKDGTQAIDQIRSENKIKIWPRTLKRGEILYVSSLKKGILCIYNTQGGLSCRTAIDADAQVKIDLPQGIYLVNIESNNQKNTMKITVE